LAWKRKSGWRWGTTGGSEYYFEWNIAMGQMTDALRRINRAKKHLNILKREISAFNSSKPYRYAIKKYPQDGYYIVRPYLSKGRYPLTWGLLIGEFAHGLRSALDNIAWSLATKRDHVTCFPIYIERNNGFDERLKRLREDIRVEVEAVQPYNRPDEEKIRHPLWILNYIDVIDKHRIILPGATRISIATGLPSPKKYLYIDGFTQLNKGTLEIKVPLPPNSEEDFKPEILAHIGFDISSPIPSEVINPTRIRLNDLFAIHHFVRNDVYPRFARFLEPKIA
jgi:hypothetical protein